MTAAVPPPSFPGWCAAPRRLGTALAASAAAHLLLVPLLGLEGPRRSARPADAASIAVRLEPRARAQPAEPVVPAQERVRAEPRISPGAGTGGENRRAAAVGARPRRKPDATAPLALPRAADPTYYAARDLDVYPRPAAPLGLERLARGVAGRFDLDLLIDESGAVNGIEVSGAGRPGRLQDELRVALAATRFFPGEKDGRAVKSRVRLSVDFGAENREP